MSTRALKTFDTINPGSTLVEAVERMGLTVSGNLAEAALAAARAAERVIVEQHQRIEALERQAYTDALTGLLNRRGFDAELEHVLASARRFGEQGALIYIDLDRFKPINDTHGHAAGDEALRQVGRLILDNVRDTDYAARLGGDEFAVLMVRTSPEDALHRARAIEAMIDDACFVWDGNAITLGASLGIQSFDGRTTMEQLLRAADAAMYETKRRRGDARQGGLGLV